MAAPKNVPMTAKDIIIRRLESENASLKRMMKEFLHKVSYPLHVEQICPKCLTMKRAE